MTVPTVLAKGAKTSTRWVALAILLSTAAFVLGGWSVLAYLGQVDIDAAQNRWDNQTDAHDTCVQAAQARAETIDIQAARFARDERYINLLDGIVSQGPPESPVIQSALAQIALERRHLAEDRADFAEKRPPLDEAQCPPAPDGPRP